MWSKTIPHSSVRWLTNLFARPKKSIFPFGTNNWESYALFKTGVEYQLHGDKERAENLFREALSKDPANRGAQINLAALDIEKGNYEEAEILLKNAEDTSSKFYDTDQYTRLYLLAKLYNPWRELCDRKLNQSKTSIQIKTEISQDLKSYLLQVSEINQWDTALQLYHAASDLCESVNDFIPSSIAEKIIEAASKYQLAGDAFIAYLCQRKLIPENAFQSRKGRLQDKLKDPQNINSSDRIEINYLSALKKPASSGEQLFATAVSHYREADSILKKVDEMLKQIESEQKSEFSQQTYLEEAQEYAEKLYKLVQKQLKRIRKRDFLRSKRDKKLLNYLQDISPEATKLYVNLICEIHEFEPEAIKSAKSDLLSQAKATGSVDPKKIEEVQALLDKWQAERNAQSSSTMIETFKTKLIEIKTELNAQSLQLQASDVDEELEKMKEMLSGGVKNSVELPEANAAGNQESEDLWQWH